MIFPAWAAYGTINAALSASNMLMQEKYKVNGFALAWWNKVACVILMTPFVIYTGFPHEIMFYVYLCFSSVLFAISDVYYFSGITKAGAGAVSRILPSSVIVSFILWFIIDPSSFHSYLQKPVIAALIFAVLCLWVYFATHLRKCAVSMHAARTVWFVIFAAMIGPLIAKEVTNTTDMTHYVFGYTFVQAVMMIVVWSFFFNMRKPVTSAVLLSRHSVRYGLTIGSVGAINVCLSVMAINSADNPAYASAVANLSSFFVLLGYAMTGRKNDGNVVAGISMVICAVALIILKAQI